MSVMLPFRLFEVRRRFGGRPFSMLDVGSGNHSTRLARQWFPACRYAGVDLVRDYNNDADDERAIALLPPRALKSKLDHGYVAGGVFWDLLGLAEYVIAERPVSATAASLEAEWPLKDNPPGPGTRRS